jgi:hypothetical protein
MMAIPTLPFEFEERELGAYAGTEPMRSLTFVYLGMCPGLGVLSIKRRLRSYLSPIMYD